MTYAVHLAGLAKRYGDVRAVDGIDLVIAPGEVVALLGPNGAGKSTAIDLVLGLIKPDAGQVSVFGRGPREAVVEGVVGAMLQAGALRDHLTVAETVGEIAALHGRHRRVGQVLERTGLTELVTPSYWLRVVDPGLAAESLAAGSSTLTQREREVLLVAATGATVRDIAQRLHLSEGTVRNHLSSAIGKTGARTSAEAARIAESRGWL
ncbi:ATP-binding cassette domain-containing protein [Allorhizocola rhizosphaerae]|uniref:ATP-binding cassette domain-containing protein n=1 Tax=Allorhizocola rhizosphaerae TaxID=1872709 RepID=UPI000E3D4636|nr:ATP-binding cassette domain-containing protein [Allorhizocola rhizosphaerae]